MTTSFPTRFTTANIAGDLSDERARRDYAAALHGSDILCTQEMQRRDAREFVTTAEWGTAQAPGPNGRARCAIHWRKDRFVEKDRGNVLLHVSRLFPSATRYIEWVRLYDKWTLRYWTVIDVHMVPHADDEVGGITKFPRRRLVMAAMKVLLHLVRISTRSQLVVMGDFNTNLRADLAHSDPDGLVEQFKLAGLTSSAEVLGVPPATHGRNLYDQMYFRLPKKAYRLTSQHVHPKRNSDHRAYSVTAMVTKRKKRGR